MWYTHLKPTILELVGQGTKSQVLLERKAFILSSMADNQPILFATDLNPHGSLEANKT